MAQADLKWVVTAIMSGFLRRQLADPDRVAQWVDAVTDVLSAAAERPTTNPQFDQILSILQEVKSISETQASSNSALTAAVATLSSDGLKAALPSVVAPSTVVFDSNDQTPNSPGGRNSSHLSGFDSTLPETS